MSHAAVERSAGVTMAAARRPRWWGVALAGAALIVAGMGYRGVASYLGDELSQKVRLPRPLSSLPLTIGDWAGEDVPLSEGVQRIAGNDDFVNRSYENRRTGQHANLYVAYTARPRSMLRHRPTVCYPSAGFSHVQTREQSVDIGGVRRPVLIHTFLKPELREYRVLVLNAYVLSGSWTVDENSFWGLGWRTPNLARDATRYVAQVQVSTPLATGPEAAEAAVLAFAYAAGPEILALLPGTASGGAGRVDVVPGGGGP